MVGLTLPVTHKPNVFISLLLEKNDGQLCWNWNFKFLARVQLPPAFRKADCFFFYFEGGQGTAGHRLEVVFKCPLEHAVSHASLAGQKDALSKLSPINPLHANISMHILHTVFHTFTERLTRRICLTIKSYFSWWLSPLFSWLFCLIQRW